MPNTWVVTNTEQHTELAPTGTGFTDVRYVYFNITSGPASGHHGMVKIPEAGYSVDNVRATVQKEVDNESDIRGLTG